MASREIIPSGKSNVPALDCPCDESPRRRAALRAPPGPPAGAAALRDRQAGLPARRGAARDPLGRDALRAHPARVLAPAPRARARARLQHRLRLPVLEPARTAGGPVRL